jgi:cytochrome b6-f complex iron-sulfur subunit
VVIALVIAIPVLLVLVAVMVFATSRRRASDAEGRVTGTLSAETRERDASARGVSAEAAEEDESEEARERADETRKAIGSGGAVAARGTTTPAERMPVDEEELAISRRQFFNRGLLITMAVSLGAFGAAAISFLYAKSAGGFGGKVDAGAGLKDILADISAKKEPFYVPEARAYVQAYPKDDVPRAKKIPQYAPVIPGMEEGVIALYQKCVHLGCKVPWCQTSQWFECPCHGSKYSRVGEKKGGPAPRGLDHFVITVSGDKLTIDTGVVITGPPIGTDTTGQGAEGPPCVGG